MSKRQITIKPTCMNEILALPADRVAGLWERINQLVADPLPDGHAKKKLKGTEGTYRLRIGDHRLFYRFDESWVNLLAIRRRQEDTYKQVPAGDEEGPPPDLDDDIEVLLAPRPAFALAPTPIERTLPIALTRDWLRSVGAPVAAWPALLQCRTEDDLLEAAVPGEVLSRVLDALFPPSLDTVARQPDLVVPSADHLVRYREGDLLGFLLRLDDEQVKLTRWALAGPTLVRGGAGTGKSTVALYRVKEVLERPGATGQETVLFTTYTQALIAVTRQLLAQILTPDQLRRVHVATCDQVARQIVSSTRKLGDFESDGDALRRLESVRGAYVPAVPSPVEARLRGRALARLSDRYLLEELDWVIEGRGITTLAEYKGAFRPGRGLAFPERLREVVWDIWQRFQADTTKERFVRLRGEARAVVASGRWHGHWDHVFVDEAQDLSAVTLGLMADVCRSSAGLFFTADVKQSLYARGQGWLAAHPALQFRGRSALLKRNYRSTREIDRAAFSLLQPNDDEVLEPSESVHEGPLPVLVEDAAPEALAGWVVRFVRQMARHLHLQVGATAVLVPTAAIGQSLAREVDSAGLPARYFAGKELDLEAPGVKVLTLHSAKGLEFPIVVVCGFEEGTYPLPEDFDDAELFAERMRHARRLLYVGLTRAMRGLLLVVPAGSRHEALIELDRSQWHVEAAG